MYLEKMVHFSNWIVVGGFLSKIKKIQKDMHVGMVYIILW